MDSHAASIFAVALAVRLIHIWQIKPSPFFDVLLGDANGYDEWAQRLAGGDWIGTEVFYQAPLYPYFLGVIYAIFGRDLLIVRIFQAVIGSASCALLGLAGRGSSHAAPASSRAWRWRCARRRSSSTGCCRSRCSTCSSCA